jgi:FkbM family methyltransferase
LHKFILTPEIIHAWGDSIIPPEQCLIEWARQFQSKDKVALDIGAHVGDWAVDMADYSKEVHAFEAQTSTYKLLLANAKGYSNIWCHSGALCEKRGDVDLAIRSPDGGGSSVVLYALFSKAVLLLKQCARTRWIAARYATFRLSNSTLKAPSA